MPTRALILRAEPLLQWPHLRSPLKQAAVVPRANKGKGKGQGAHPVQVAVCQKWWPGKVVAATKALSRLDEGCAPDASLVVATWEQCKNFRVLAAAHKLDAKLAIVCSDLKQKPEKPGVALERRWVHLQQGNWKQVFVAPSLESCLTGEPNHKFLIVPIASQNKKTLSRSASRWLRSSCLKQTGPMPCVSQQV